MPSHNVHYIASSGDEALHISVRIPRPSVETAEELEFIARLETYIPSKTASLVKTNILSRYNRYLEPLDDARLLSVRQHWGKVCSKTHDIAALIGVTSEHGGALSRIESSDFRCGSTILRYAAPSEAIPAIRERIQEFVSKHSSGAEMRKLLTHLEQAASILESAPASPRFVHGDLSYQNLVLDDSGLQVIDHDCLHFDHPFYDLAHLMLSVSCSGYFSGNLQENIVQRFLRCAKERMSVRCCELCAVASYVILKKTALVRTPINLHITERLAILDDLQRIRLGFDYMD
jgi:hypothetical protein